MKTTRHFYENDPSLLEKQPVVFNRILHRSKKIILLVADRILIIFSSLTILLFESANFSKSPSSRARVRAHT